MTEELKISRRDFLNGCALSLAAGTTLTPLELLARQANTSAYYPPALTGMRGSHPGSFEVAHALSWGGTTWSAPDRLTDDIYDLVVVGGGISGLSAAHFFREAAGPGARILVLDNHDDFGGHAKRNEFSVNGQTLIGYGGSQSIDSPATYSPAASQLLKDIGIHTDRFYEYFDRDYYASRNLKNGVYFSQEKYGADVVRPNVLRFPDDVDPATVRETIEGYPISEAARKSFLKLLQSDEDYLSGKTMDEKVALMKRISFTDWLREYAGADEEVVLILRDTIKGYWGFGFDALSAMEGLRLGMPGTWYLGIEEENSGPAGREEPYIFHFPDGNAGVARSLVRKLLPDAVPGKTMEDLVRSRVNYDLLDLDTENTRIRLNSTAVDVRHVDNDGAVDIVYVRDGEPARVRAKHAVLACYNNIIPHLCQELPETQVEAIGKVTKIPLVYISVAVRNWKAFENLGYQSFYVPQPTLMHSFGMDFPVSMGGYEFTQKSSEPTIVHGTWCPTVPDQGLTEREQHVAGRRELYETSFADIERGIIRQMSGALESGGFEADRDIAALTVNRWPHGYAYEYNELFDPPGWSKENGPHQLGAARVGRISIANSDAEAYAYVNGAIDAAYRAVNEQLTNS